VPDGFHARFDARSKTYRYRIWNASVLSPFERDYVWHVPEPALDVDAMAKAARALEGERDFAAFQGAGQVAHSTVRTVFESSVTRRDDLITVEIRGDGFLRHMVRAITGSLVEVGRGREPAAWLDDVLDSRTRGRAGRTAPAAGLFLVRVDY
jgi:tRNA pseudouridine38-40 synthase